MTTDKKIRALSALLALVLVQLSCSIYEFYDDRSDRERDRDRCVEKGGIWHDFPYLYCEMPPATATYAPESGGTAGDTLAATDTPVGTSTQACDAYDSLSIETVITEQAQYDTWSSCQYYLRVTNRLPGQDVWIWIRHLHATQSGTDRDEWDSATVQQGGTREWSFSGSINNDGTFGHSYASEITAIKAVPECNDMRSKSNAITLARPLQWFCEP